MNILIYTPPSKLNYVRIGRCGGSTKSGTEFPPIKLMYLTGVARKRANVLFIDADAEGISLKEFLERISKFKPGIVVAEPTPSSLKDEIAAAEEIRRLFKGARIIFTGPFVSAIPGEILEKYKEVDCVIEGEAEKTLEEFIERKKNVKGLYYRENRSIKYNGQQNFIENLDELPFPAHDLIPARKYISAFIKKSPYTIVETSCGCPFSCIYCNAFLSSGRRVRFRTIENIIDELRWVRSLGMKGIYFNDETFTFNKERLIKLMKAMIEEKLNFSWVCNSRVDTINEEMLGLMKKAGCTCIFYGVESGNQPILDYYKKNIKVGDILKIFNLTKKFGIETMAHFMIGAPDESLETINNTVDFAKKINPDLASFNILTPYPGTGLFEDLKKRGLIKLDDWTLLDQTIKATLKTKYLTVEDLELAAKMAYKSFYYRPSYVLKKVFKIRSVYDFLKNIKGFFRFLNLVKK